MTDQTRPEIAAVHERNKARRHEAIKVQKREQKEKDIKYFMDQLSSINTDYKICQDPAVKKLLLDKWYGVVKLCTKKIEEK